MYDVCLLLEGTYPYITGGVSSWVHRLISAMPDIDFCGICILPDSNREWDIKYELPPNFRHLEVVYPHDYDIKPRTTSKSTRMKQMETLRTFHQNMRTSQYGIVDDILPIFAQKKGSMSVHEMLKSKESWRLLLEFYKPDHNHESFIDYFWTFRFMHAPLFKLLSMNLPEARVYHSISTGYAGILGVVAKHRYQRPFLITEHGIYTKERKIEISQAEWIYMSNTERIRINKELGFFQQLWVNFFSSLGRIAYHKADKIYTLYEGNRQMEIAEGANPHKIEVIPNGIDVKRFSGLRPVNITPAKDQPCLNVGFVGRVVPIKDVKTFIRACKIVSLQITEAKFYIMGPLDEDPNYFEECKELVNFLKLEDCVTFTGKINVMDYYPTLDVMVLTSISEAQPLVILEASCAGIPTVASDVGSCRELLEGRTLEDKQLGISGIVTRVADPVDTANGIIKLLTFDNIRQHLSKNGRKRVATYYQEADLNQKYEKIYKHYMNLEA